MAGVSAETDPLGLIEMELRASLALPPEIPEPELPELFDENAYLDAFPDVLTAIRRGDVASAVDHFRRYGETELRLDTARYRAALAGTDTDGFPPHGLDAAFITRTGRCLVIGWIDDTNADLREIALIDGRDHLGATRAIARCRRADAEELVDPPPGSHLGFWTLFKAPQWRGAEHLSVSISAGRFRRTAVVAPKPVTEQRLREIALEYLAAAAYHGNPQVDGAMQLDGGLGAEILDLNLRISDRIRRRGAYCRRFGPQREHYVGSLVVCLYGKPEFLFLQASLFSGFADWQDYEFVYVVNSPEIAEGLLKEATLAARIYDVSITVVVLSGNAGFGAANNIAVEYARSRRILICNPDVFPRRSGVGREHAALVEQAPSLRTRIFGAPLFYDDGSLMHGGMFFEIDEGVSLRRTGIARRPLIRVEHFGKGAPPATHALLEPRPVPAVTGAFISIDRAWFERIGGFSLEYVFGHYEDADLCLKSLAQGQPVWMQSVPFWHLEGKGSTRRHAHEGGSLVNRWHFSELWGGLIAEKLEGRNPVLLPEAAR